MVRKGFVTTLLTMSALSLTACGGGSGSSNSGNTPLSLTATATASAGEYFSDYSNGIRRPNNHFYFGCRFRL
ncbi:hypothetical protein ALON55S_08135 [Alishewanella longhuensis]